MGCLLESSNYEGIAIITRGGLSHNPALTSVAGSSLNDTHVHTLLGEDPFCLGHHCGCSPDVLAWDECTPSGSIQPQALPPSSCVTLDGPQRSRPWLPHPLHKESGQAVPRAPSVIHLGSLGSQCQKGALTKAWVGFSLTTVFHSTKEAAHCPLSTDV